MNATYISLGSLMLQTVVTVISISVASADIKSDVAVLKAQLVFLQEQQRDFKVKIEGLKP